MLKQNKVSIESIDGHVWNAEQIVTEMIQYINRYNRLIVNDSGEGPCLRATGIERLIDLAVSVTNLDPTLVTIETGNLLSSTDKYKQVRQNNLFELDQYHTVVSTPNDIDIKYHFGNFIGRSNWLRLSIASTLYTKHREQTLQTFHWHPNHEYHVNHLGLEKLLNRVGNIDHVMEFINQCPITLHEYSQYPIMNKDSIDLSLHYNNIFLDVACETYFSGNVFFITEKTWRSIALHRPFIIQGPKFYLENLRRLGFKTFDYWFNEAYDEDPWDYKHIVIADLLDDISKWSLDDVKQAYKEMTPILEHNYQRLKTLTWEEIAECQFVDSI